MTFQSEVINTLARWLLNAGNVGGVIFGLLLLGATLLFPQRLDGFLGRWREKL